MKLPYDKRWIYGISVQYVNEAKSKKMYKCLTMQRFQKDDKTSATNWNVQYI